MSQSPEHPTQFDYEGGYAAAAKQLNRLVRAGKSYSGHERNCCFLNVDGGQFANVSMLSGFDFPEDSRSVALCDWDGDGDQDFWVANRTAPQVRLMQNQLVSDRKFVQFQLESDGVKSNRDAVGARVCVTVRQSQAEPVPIVLKRTLRAGEGFLACSSKLLHFGLGEAARIESVSVTWPSGSVEEFRGELQTNQRYQLREGSGRAEARLITPTRIEVPIESPMPSQGLATHNLLSEAVPLPPLFYRSHSWQTSEGQTSEGQQVDLSLPRDRPTLVNLWASWCQPCLAELSEWSIQLQEADDRLRVVAISVESDSDLSSVDANQLLTQLGYRAESGRATPQLLDTLQLLHNAIYDHHRPLPVPTSVLIDEQGKLRAIYKGPVSLKQVRADVDKLGSHELLAVALPFPGRWLGQPPTHNLSQLVEDLFRDGYEAEADVYVERLVDDRLLAKQLKARLFLASQLAIKSPSTALRHGVAALLIDPKNASANERVALLLARAGNLRAAMQHFETALANSDPPQARTCFNYGRLLRQAGQVDAAIEQFQRAVDAVPDFAEAHEQLGLMLAGRRDFAAAVEHFRMATQSEPSEHRHRVNLALAHSNMGDDMAAWQALEAIATEPTLPTQALLLGAKSLAGMQRYGDAIPLLELAHQRDPRSAQIKQMLAQVRSLAAKSSSPTPAVK